MRSEASSTRSEQKPIDAHAIGKMEPKAHVQVTMDLENPLYKPLMVCT